MKNIITAIVIVFMFSSNLCAERKQDGNELLQDLNTLTLLKNGSFNGDMQDMHNALGSAYYILGIVDMNNAYRHSLPEKIYREGIVSFFFFCCHEDVSTIQYIQVVSKYLLNHPEKLHLPRTALIIESLAQAFPCQNRKDK